jgi:hypothetical protein
MRTPRRRASSSAHCVESCSPVVVGSEARHHAITVTTLRQILIERCFQIADGSALDAELGVAPVILVLSVALPVIGDADAARECQAPVDYEYLPMIAVARLLQRIPAERMEAPDAASRFFQPLQLLAWNGCPVRVDDDVDIDSPPTRRDHGCRELLGNVAVIVDVGEEIDPAFGGANSIDVDP